MTINDTVRRLLKEPLVHFLLAGLLVFQRSGTPRATHGSIPISKEQVLARHNAQTKECVHRHRSQKLNEAEGVWVTSLDRVMPIKDCTNKYPASRKWTIIHS